MLYMLVDLRFTIILCFLQECFQVMSLNLYMYFLNNGKFN